MDRYRLRTALLVVTLLPLFPIMSIAQEPTPYPAESPHPFAGETAWVAYYGSSGVWIIHPDGTGNHRVARDVPGDELLANWSPDGTKLVFTTRGEATEPLYEYELATGEFRQLFACEDPCVGDDEPAYSPDGSKVIFTRYLGPFVENEDLGGEVPSDCGIWVGDVETGEVSQLTSNTDCNREYAPKWSPDGTQITYWRDPYEDGQPTGTSVFVMNADGTGERELTDPEMFAGSPDWSPDGEWIVFDTYPLNEFQCCQVSNLYRMRPDGTGVEQLTFLTDEDLRATQPRYTPDGQWILFTASAPTSRSMWMIPADGGEPIVLVSGGVHTHNTWQPMPASEGTPMASPVT